MKAFVAFLVLCSLTLASRANEPYRNYLLSKIYMRAKPVEYHPAESTRVVASGAYIPRFEMPKGAIFCRMEDQVTKATRVWLKLGVQ
jgi:hypothetical protein